MLFLRVLRRGSNLGLRTFMSPGYSCKEAWESRLKSRILSKVNLEEMYCELDNKFTQNNTATAIDVDIFANSLNSDSHLQELADLIYKFRLNIEASNILPSTGHAFIRAFYEHGDVDELMRILDDRINYGIFPDDYCSILLMDGFINKNDFKNASKVGTLEMLQENFDNSLLNYMSLYSCHKYLLNPVESEIKEVEEETQEDDEEVIRIRVGFLRNPYFDDHFDLRSLNSLIGKTLLNIGQKINDINYQILGAVLYSKYEYAKQLIDLSIQNKNDIYEICLNLATQSLKSLPPQEGEEGNKVQNEIQTLLSEIENLKNKNKIINKDPLIKIEDIIKKLVSEKEPELISKQKEIYNNWESIREEKLLQELKELHRLARIDEIKKKKEELERKEEKLFFFENEDKLDLTIENKRVRYPKKYLGKKKPKRTDNVDYVPPEIIKRRPTV